MIRASFGFSLMALCVKLAARTLPSGEIIFFRSFIGTLMVGALILRKRVSFLGQERGLMALRGFTGFIALSLHFYTIAHLPLGMAVMLNYTAPIFAALFSVLFLKEKLGPFRSAMIFVSFVGIYLLTGGGFHGPLLMIGLGLLSAVFVGIVYVSIRAIKGDESPLTIIFYFTAVSTLGSLAFLPASNFHWPGFGEWLLLLCLAVGSFYGQMWMTLALRRAPASLVSPFSYLTPVLSFFYGTLFLGERLTTTALLGASLIILSSICIIRLETYSETTIN